MAGRFLTSHELDTLRAVTARLVPGPPDDPDPGALEAGAAEAIDVLLGAFAFTPPRIHAGGPFSDRAGAAHDDLAAFVPLDPEAELGWRIRLEGSRGRPEWEFAGPVEGLQEVYRRGLRLLDERSRGKAGAVFVAAPPAAQDAILGDRSDRVLAAFVAIVLDDTLAAVYGPPEYGGNRRLAGWVPTRWRGDVQPRGFTDEEVIQPDAGPTLSREVAEPLLDQFLHGLAGTGPAGSAPWRTGPRRRREVTP